MSCVHSTTLGFCAVLPPIPRLGGNVSSDVLPPIVALNNAAPIETLLADVFLDPPAGLGGNVSLGDPG